MIWSKQVINDVNQVHIKRLEQLPKGWAEKTVSEVVKMISTNGKKLPQKAYMKTATHPIIDQGKQYIGGYHDNTELLVEEEPPFIIFGDHSRSFKFANFKFIPGADGIKVMRPIGIDSKWAFYIFQAIRLPNKGYARHFQYLKEAYLPVPPLEQQKRIVAKIEKLFSHIDAGIAALNQAKQLLKRYRQSILKAAVTGELTKQWRKENKDKLEPASQLLKRIIKEKKALYESSLNAWKVDIGIWKASGKEGDKPRKPRKLDLNIDISKNTVQDNFQIPKDWLKVNLNFAVSKLGDGLHGTPLYGKGEYHFINGSNLSNGKILIKSKTKTVCRYEAKKYYRELNNRTVLVSINGTLGNVAFYDNEKVILGKSTCYFNLLPKFSKEYIRWILESIDFKNYAEKAATGSTIKNVSLKAMREFVIPLCCMQEQQKIVSIVQGKINSLERLENEIDNQITKAEKSKQSILASAFKGKLG